MFREQRLFPRNSDVDQKRMNQLVVFISWSSKSALSFLVGWRSGTTCKRLVPLIPKDSVPEQVEESK